MNMTATGLVLCVLIGISLGFFGGGGSILTVPLLVYVFGLAPKTAIASSLLIVGAASLSGVIQRWRSGDVDPRTGLLFGSAGMLGAYLGGRAGAFFDGALLLLLFAAMMALTAVAMWRGRGPSQGAAGGMRSPARLLAQGLAVGAFTGLVGAGGGFMIVPALNLWAGLAMPVAVGTSLLVIVMNCVAGFSGYAAHVDVDLRLVGTVMAIAIAGSLLGSSLARRVDPASLRRAFAGFVGVMAVAILAREAPLWLGGAREALPSTMPQLVFALVMLGVGIAAGRVSRRAGGDPLAERVFSEGAGI